MYTWNNINLQVENTTNSLFYSLASSWDWMGLNLLFGRPSRKTRDGRPFTSPSMDVSAVPMSCPAAPSAEHSLNFLLQEELTNPPRLAVICSWSSTLMFKLLFLSSLFSSYLVVRSKADDCGLITTGDVGFFRSEGPTPAINHSDRFIMHSLLARRIVGKLISSS